MPNATATRYRLTVWATVPNDEDGTPSFDKREVERHIYRVLQKAEPDCDCEVMDSEQIDEGEA